MLLALTGQTKVMETDTQGRESMNIRAGYLQPLHYLQIELLERIRNSGQSDDCVAIATLERGMMVAISGIAIGMRNTG